MLPQKTPFPFQRATMKIVLLGAAFLSAAQAGADSPKIPETPSSPALEIIQKQFPDLTSHPLAGEEIRVQIINKDGLAQRGQSNTQIVKLPQRKFRSPVVNALSGYRKALAQAYAKSPAVAAEQAKIIARDMDKLLQDQAQNIPDPALLDALKNIQKNLAAAQDVKTVDQVVQDLWPIMLKIEEEVATAAEKKLKEAEKALREALAKKLTAEELSKAMEDARKAMDEALQHMQDRAKDAKNEQTAKELEEMHKILEEMRKMLEKMQRQMKKVKINQELQDIVEKQEKIVSATSEIEQQRKADLDKIEEQWEKNAAIVDKQIEEKINQKQTEKDKLDENNVEKQNALNKQLAESTLSDEAKQAKRDELTTQESTERDPINQKLNELYRLKFQTNEARKSLKEKREEKQIISESEAKDMIDKLDQAQNKDAEGGPKEDQVNPPDQLKQMFKEMQEKGNTKNIEAQQQSLQKQLHKMIEGLQQQGIELAKLPEAEKDMGDASHNLEQNNSSDALTDENKALQALLESSGEGPDSGIGDGAGQGNASSDPNARLMHPEDNVTIDPSGQVNLTRQSRDKIRQRLAELPQDAPQSLRDYLQGLANPPTKKPAP